MRTWTVGAVGEPRIRSVWFDAQKPRVNEHVEHLLTQRPVDTAEPLRLLAGQAQARHFQKLATHTFQQGVVRYDGHAVLEASVLLFAITKMCSLVRTTTG